MNHFYCLRILTERVNIEQINAILEIESKPNLPYWEYEIINQCQDKGIDFISIFCDILEPKIDLIFDLGITINEITIIDLYEYYGQCNLEYPSDSLKRLGNLNLSLCISCWETDRVGLDI